MSEAVDPTDLAFLFANGRVRIDHPELAQEASKRVVAGLVRACRAFVPTRENLEGKKEHCDVTLLDGALYIGTDHSVYAAVIRPRLAEFCKKRSPLRAAFAALGNGYGATLNYGTVSPWLKLHEKNIQFAEFGPDGIRLVVAEGVVELDMAVTPESAAYGQGVIETLAERVLDANLLHGPLPLEPGGEGLDTLCVQDDRAWYAERIDLEQPWVQMKFKASMLPAGEQEVRVYADPHGGKIVRVTTESETLHVEQYFRILDLVEAPA